MWAPGGLPRPHQALSPPGSSPASATLFLQPERPPPPAAADKPAPPAAPESVRPPPAWPSLWSHSLAVGFTPVALGPAQSPTHPQAAGHRPSGQCSLSLPHSKGSPCPVPPAPPKGSAPLPWTHCRLGGPSRSRAQGLAEHANKVNAGTQNVPFLATKLSETEVRI